MPKYINADVLFEKFEQNTWWDNQDREEAEDILLDMPAEDVIPFRQGHWSEQDEEGFFWCSACVSPTKEKTGCCPWCGAWMKEETK